MVVKLRYDSTKATVDTNSTLSDIESRHQSLSEVVEPVDRGEVLRYMGYPQGFAPTSEIQHELEHWIDQATTASRPHASFIVLPVEGMTRRSLRLHTNDGVVEFSGAIGEFLGVSQKVCLFIATAGWEIERLASQMGAEGNPLAALIVNAVGAERAEAAEYAVIEQIRQVAATDHLAPTLPYSPGYCGMALTEQAKLFQLFEGVESGVELTENFLMRPLKSVSGLIGIGPANDVTLFDSPCERCELGNCSMRR